MNVDVQASAYFIRRLKRLSKRYRSIKEDVAPIIEKLKVGNFIGDKIQGLESTVFKVRAKNRDIPTGKSGGYRIIYQIASPDEVILLLIYAKSDMSSVSESEIRSILQDIDSSS